MYDIRFESVGGGKFWRAVFEIRSDSDGDGLGEPTDDVAVGVEITVKFAGVDYTGTTDASGIFRTDLVKNLNSGSYVAEVQSLALLGYLWDKDMGYPGDDDGDGLPDNILDLS